MIYIKCFYLICFFLFPIVGKADWIAYPSKSKFIQYSYEQIGRSKKGSQINLKLLTNYSKEQDVEINNLSISYLSRVDYVTLNCKSKTKKIRKTAYELYEERGAVGWNYKGRVKRPQWKKVSDKSTLGALFKQICSS